MKAILKNPRFLIWIFFIVISVILIAPNLNAKGIAVTSVNKTITDVPVGEVIYSVNGDPATLASLSKEYFGIIRLETKSGTRYVNANGTLGLDGKQVAPTSIKFGLDITGGVHAVLEPNVSTNATISQIISTLETRINIYGLRESIFRPLYSGDKGYIEVSIAGGTTEELRNLIESQGNFEAKIPFVLPVASNKATLVLDKNYVVSVVSNSSVMIENKTVNTEDHFTLAGIDFVLNTVNTGSLNLTAKVFGGADILTVYFDPQRSRIEQQNAGSYKWSFAVQLSNGGAQKFAWVTNNVKVLTTGYLDAPIVFYLDSNLIDSLNIASTLKGKPETEIAISGGASSFDEAAKSKTKLQSILRSGALPTSVQIVQLDTISPSLGAGFLKNALLAGAAAMVGVLIAVSVRYRKPKLVLPMVAISFSEVLIVVGLGSGLFNWTIDLPAIAGIIASVGTGIDSQIIILDRAIRKEEEHLETLHEKLKKAFFVIFGAAGTVIAAMIPLTFTGFGALRGFALITILGVLIGILIARPAYGVIIEHLQHHE